MSEEQVHQVVTTPEKVSVSKKMSNLQLFGLGIGGILILVLLGFVVWGVSATKKVSQNKFVLSVAKVLNLSAAKVNGSRVSYADYIEDLQTLNKFYKATPEVPTPSAEQISDQVLSRLIANTLIGKLAKQYNVVVEQKDLDEFKANILTQFGGDEAKAREELQTKYGWTLEKYMSRIVKPILMEQKLQTAFQDSTVEGDSEYSEVQVQASHILFMVKDPKEDAKVKAQAQKVLNEIKAGADFAEKAKEFGSDSTKETGGDLGWFGAGQMVPEFEKAVFALKEGELGQELVKTQFGYHIVKLTGKKQAKNYMAFMDNQFKNAEIKILLPVHNPFEQLQATTTDTQNVDVENVEVSTTEPATVEVK